MTQPALPSVSPAARYSRRRRKLRWTIAIVALVVVASIAAGLLYSMKTRPQAYRPDEANPEITSRLSRGLPSDAPTPRFTDITGTAGLGQFRTFIGARTSQLPEDMGPGAAWGDFDNDGDDDLFLVSAGGPLNNDELAPSLLFENTGNGAFRQLAITPEIRIRGMGAAWGDYDSDGFLDLIVSGYNTLLLFHNEPSPAGRRLVRDERFPNLNGFWAGVSWGDFNNDRHLDLYVCGYVKYSENDADRARGSEQLGTLVPFTLNPASYEPELNLLFRNNGDGQFTECAKELQVENPTGRSLGALWHDFDQDGWLDLYIANDISDNVLYRNKEGTFEDISHAAWVADYRSAMGLAAGDWNRDGDDDLYVTHWVAQENAFYDNLLADFNQPGYSRTNAPSSTQSAAQRSDGAAENPKRYGLRFMDVADMKGLGQMALPYVGWGAEFVDLDADGWLDLVVANGNTLETSTEPKQLKPQETFLLWNRRGEHFHDLGPLNDLFRQQHVGRGLACSDFDRDGDVDVLIVHLGEGVQLLRNEMQTGNWAKFRLRSQTAKGAPNGFGDGATVIANLDGAVLRRCVSSVSYLSQSSRVLHFGLGSATTINSLEVRWLGGGTNWFTNLTANAEWELTEGDPVARRASNAVTAGISKPAAFADERARTVEFWRLQRAAMDALKLNQDVPGAAALFRQALELNPAHEDSRYYLAHCLAAQGDLESALAALEELKRRNPNSHRAWQQWAVLRAVHSQAEPDLAAAEQALERAHAINPEETGALLVLGEIALLRGRHQDADARLAAACKTNPRAAGGFFLRAFIAWKSANLNKASELLTMTREALGPEWQPKGATSEGDVLNKWHTTTTPLSQFWENWDGSTNLETSFTALDHFLKSQARP